MNQRSETIQSIINAASKIARAAYNGDIHGRFLNAIEIDLGDGKRAHLRLAVCTEGDGGVFKMDYRRISDGNEPEEAQE
jgi:hypothetical protein